LIVVDGVEGREYDGIGSATLRFSPDSKRLAYLAQRGDEWRIVVDEAESEAYDAFLPGVSHVFDSARSLHTVAYRNEEFFRVQVEIKEPSHGA
jgi:hypothetical protein